MNFLYAEPLWAHKESLVMTATRRALGEAPALVCVCQAGAASCSLAAAWEGHNCAVKKACVWLSQVLTAQTWRTGTWTCWTRLERSTLYPAATHKTGEAQIRESRWERERGGREGAARDDWRGFIWKTLILWFFFRHWIWLNWTGPVCKQAGLQRNTESRLVVWKRRRDREIVLG